MCAASFKIECFFSANFSFCQIGCISNRHHLFPFNLPGFHMSAFSETLPQKTKSDDESTCIMPACKMYHFPPKKKKIWSLSCTYFGLFEKWNERTERETERERERKKKNPSADTWARKTQAACNGGEGGGGHPPTLPMFLNPLTRGIHTGPLIPPSFSSAVRLFNNSHALCSLRPETPDTLPQPRFQVGVGVRETRAKQRARPRSKKIRVQLPGALDSQPSISITFILRHLIKPLFQYFSFSYTFFTLSRNRDKKKSFSQKPGSLRVAVVIFCSQEAEGAAFLAGFEITSPPLPFRPPTSKLPPPNAHTPQLS